MRKKLIWVAAFVLVAGVAAAAFSCASRPPAIAEDLIWDQGSWNVQGWK